MIGKCFGGDKAGKAFVEPDRVDQRRQFPVEREVAGAVKPFWNPRVDYVMCEIEPLSFKLLPGGVRVDYSIDAQKVGAAVEMLHAETVRVILRDGLENLDLCRVMPKRR